MRPLSVPSFHPSVPKGPAYPCSLFPLEPETSAIQAPHAHRQLSTTVRGWAARGSPPAVEVYVGQGVNQERV